jgi:cytochrome b6-f complex iron-sulfur subunit
MESSMTTKPGASSADTKSRLEPEPMPRRDFLGLMASWSALAAALFAMIGAGRLPRAAVVPVASRKYKVALPETLADGQAFIPPGRSVAVFRDGDGIHAVSLICTHLGCIVKTESDGFHCPCHGSAYKPDGSVSKGPAPKALPWLQVTRVAAHTYMVDESKTVAAGTKVIA